MHRGYFDASYNGNGAKAGIKIVDNNGVTRLQKTIVLHGVFDSMEAEYAALLQLLKRAAKMGIKSLKVFGDCLGLIETIIHRNFSKKYEKFIHKIYDIIDEIFECCFEWLPRNKNKEAHNLASRPVSNQTTNWVQIKSFEKCSRKQKSFGGMLREMKSKKRTRK